MSISVLTNTDVLEQLKVSGKPVWKQVIIIVLVVQNLGTSERLLSNLCWEMDRKSEAEVTGVQGHCPLTVQSASTRNASLLSPARA